MSVCSSPTSIDFFLRGGWVLVLAASWPNVRGSGRPQFLQNEFEAPPPKGRGGGLEMSKPDAIIGIDRRGARRREPHKASLSPESGTLLV